MQCSSSASYCWRASGSRPLSRRTAASAARLARVSGWSSPSRRWRRAVLSAKQSQAPCRRAPCRYSSPRRSSSRASSTAFGSKPAAALPCALLRQRQARARRLDGVDQVDLEARLPREAARRRPAQQRLDGARLRQAVGIAFRQRAQVLDGAGRECAVQLDFVEVVVERQLRNAVAVAQQLLEPRLVAGDALVRIAAAPQQAPLGIEAVDAAGHRIHQQRALRFFVAAAVVDGARDDAGQALEAARVRREHADQAVGQQRGADAHRRRAPAAAVDQHVAEVARQVGGERPEQGRAGREQAVPVHAVGALAVAVVETAGAHQVQRAALVDALDIGFPVDRFEHQPGALLVVVAPGAAQGLELLAAGFEVFEQARTPAPPRRACS